MSTYTRMGTIVASAVVSREPDRSGNFICDGTADEVEINAAIVYVGTLGGGSVTLLHGTYNIAAQIVDGGYNNILLQGVGWTTILFAVAGLNASPVSITSVSGWTIQNLKVNGNGANQTADMSAIYFNTVTDSLVFNVETLGGHRETAAQGEGIELETSTLCTVSHCKSHDNDYDGVKLRTNSHYNIVIGNTLYENGTSGVQASGGSSSNTIANNIVYYETAGGVTRGVTLHNAVRNSVTSNTFYKCVWGISILDASNHNVVAGNTASECEIGVSLHGPGDCEYNVIADNTLNSCYGNSIHLQPTYCHRNLIVENQIYNSGVDSIRVEDGNIRNAILNNFIRTSGERGIKIYTGCTDTRVEGNTILDIAWDAIQVRAGAVGTIIKHNYLFDNTTPIADAGTGTIINDNEGNVGIYQTADYGAAWVNWVANIVGTPANGTRCVFYNTNGAGAHRLGCYSNGAWHYVDLT